MAGSCILNKPLTNEQILNTLASVQYCSLATCNDNFPQVRPYLYAFSYINNVATIYLEIVTTSPEYSNILVNPNVSIQFQNQSTSSENYLETLYDTVIVNGKAVVVTNFREKMCIREKIACRSILNEVALGCLEAVLPSAIIKVTSDTIIGGRYGIIIPEYNCGYNGGCNC